MAGDESKVVSRRDLILRMGPVEALRRITAAMRAQDPEEAGLSVGRIARRAKSNALKGTFRLYEGSTEHE